MSQYTITYQTVQTDRDTFFHTYQQMADQEERHLFFESGRGGRYSIAGLRPFAFAKGKDEDLTIHHNGTQQTMQGDLVKNLIHWMEPYRTEPIPELPDFQGGAAGYISYDYVRSIEKLPEQAKDDLDLPEVYMLFFDEFLVFDHHTDTLYFMLMHSVLEPADDRLEALLSKWKSCETNQSITAFTGGDPEDEMTVSMDEEAFAEAAEAIRTYISQGDVFQVNLSVRQAKPLKVKADAVYRELREFNPSPYMSYIHLPEFQIASASPELLVKKAGTELSTRPIAGTRSRGQDAKEDQRLADELIQNEKERAEHVMLVDLERNDLGRVSQYGSVEVNEFMVIEKYSHVMHIVSNVRGTLDEQYDEADVIRAVFPGGTITGAPKVRTMEIIEELEPVRRGLYTGSIGWVGFNGDMELNIVIRTMLVKDETAYVQAGAGVVIDSHPKREYKESLKKARALWQAKDQAESRGMNS
ncbi:anthranilate synthase component I family protein [Jeotgalibacillus sp. R-1-5s-1]|uniref:anthranilate synthase component I family protein n=1 Tax=Jeotgalibacillus sp. R-1-5s-1 TaxID=2555897 RepID=UPI00106C382A|nr:anthranilate synthase component I family protein [Jeotgalibacillus sp. R-1-5s-1]TFE01940.1 anthranilate synthase component I family protein [Jeotgalibacillus sp. R-1-5s-1]